MLQNSSIMKSFPFLAIKQLYRRKIVFIIQFNVDSVQFSDDVSVGKFQKQCEIV